jgi:hypothetical protein
MIISHFPAALKCAAFLFGGLFTLAAVGIGFSQNRRSDFCRRGSKRNIVAVPFAIVAQAKVDALKVESIPKDTNADRASGRVSNLGRHRRYGADDGRGDFFEKLMASHLQCVLIFERPLSHSAALFEGFARAFELIYHLTTPSFGAEKPAAPCGTRGVFQRAIHRAASAKHRAPLFARRHKLKFDRAGLI